MATHRLPKFTNPDFLMKITPERLISVFRPYQGYLLRRQFELPDDRAGEIDYETLSAIIIHPQEDVPREMVEALYYIHEMSSIEQMDDLLAAAKARHRPIDVGPDASPADVAARVWLAYPDLLREQADIPDTLRQSIGVQLAVFGSNGNGSTAVTITSIAVDVKNVDQTSAARLLPMQVLPAEKQAANGTSLRSYSVQDIADIGFAATPAPTVHTGSSYTLTLADNHRLVECANAGAISVTVATDAAVFFPVGARIEIVQAGAGQITVSASGVTLRLPAGKAARTRLQYSIIALTKRNMDEWILSGDLA